MSQQPRISTDGMSHYSRPRKSIKRFQLFHKLDIPLLWLLPTRKQFLFPDLADCCSLHLAKKYWNNNKLRIQYIYVYTYLYNHIILYLYISIYLIQPVCCIRSLCDCKAYNMPLPRCFSIPPTDDSKGWRPGHQWWHTPLIYFRMVNKWDTRSCERFGMVRFCCLHILSTYSIWQNTWW